MELLNPVFRNCSYLISFPFQSKDIRKNIQKYFKQFTNLTEDQCVSEFFDMLIKIHRFDLEVYTCSLGVSKM